MDEEHIGLFDAMQALGEDPTNVDLLNLNRDLYRDHFDFEEKQFLQCGVACGAEEHKKKHDTFFKTLTWVTVPISQEYLNFAKKKEAWDIIWQFFVIEYSLITGKFALMQELGIKGIPVLKDLWNASHTTPI